MGSLSTTRRSFLRNALSLAVISTVTPGAILARITPTFHRSSAGEVVARYKIRVADFPELGSVGGSVKLNQPREWRLNPDHFANYDGITSFPIAVTRVGTSGGDAFKAVSTYCTHAAGYQLLDYNATAGMFVCPHQQSAFRADGTHIPPTDPSAPNPAAPAGLTNLRAFPTEFDGTFLIINDVLPVSTLSVKSTGEPPAKLFLDQNYPNPFNPSTVIRYGVPADTRVKVTVHTLLGNVVKTLVDQQQDAGTYYIDFSGLDLPSGAYFYRLQTSVGTLTRRMVISK